METLVDLSTILRNVVTALALAIGGGWAYFKFIRGRTFKERLKITVDGEMEPSSNLLRVSVSCEAENIGLREFRMAREGTSLTLFAHTLAEPSDQARETSWELMGAWRAFEDRTVLEPGEALQEPVLLEVPEGGFAALMLELTVYSRSGRYWKAASVVTDQARGDNQGRR
jgi:hypothetical protein